MNYFSYFSTKTYVVGTQKNPAQMLFLEHPKHLTDAKENILFLTLKAPRKSASENVVY